MDKHHSYHLHPYHNPDRVDDSKVPRGWRFRYADEAGTRARGKCRAWLFWRGGFDSEDDDWHGDLINRTYIVPVA